MLQRHLWDQKLAYLEKELASSWAAFKASAAFAVVDTTDTAADAAADSTTSLAKLVGAATDAPSDGNAMAGKAEKEAGPTAADSYADYVPSKLDYGPPHVEHVVESASGSGSAYDCAMSCENSLRYLTVCPCW